MNSETISEGSVGPEEISAFGWTIQRGYLYRVIYGPDAPTVIMSLDGDRELALGYHGNDVPPCGASYLYGDDDELLVISSEDDPERIPAFDGVTLERVTMEAGDHRHDGTWEFRVLGVEKDGETVIAGKC